MDIIDASVALSACTDPELQDAMHRISDEVKRRDTRTADDSVATADIVRLEVNLAPDVADILRENARRKNLSITEAVRRAIAVWTFIEKAKREGGRLALIENLGDGEQRLREVILSD